MDHVVYVDTKAGELKQLLDGTKTMVVRGAAGRKMPHGRVNSGDVLYFIQNGGQGQVEAKALVTSVFNSEKLSPQESAQLLEQNRGKLQLKPAQVERWAGKRYLVLIEVGDTQKIEPFAIDKSAYGNMDDWLPVGAIDSVKIQA